MEDISWLRSRIDLNEELLWRARQISRRLLDYRAEIAAQWDDTAARQVNDRFLVPHEEDEARLLERLGQQHAALADTLAELEQLCEAAAAADRLSEKIDAPLEQARAELARATENLDRCTDASLQSQSACSSAESLVLQADLCVA